MSAHTASWHRPTGRHAAQDWVLVRRWARHALRVVLHLARRYRPRHRLREAFGADDTYVAELAGMATTTPLCCGDAPVLCLADDGALLAVTEVPDLSVSLAHRRRAAWMRWAPRAGAQ